MIRMKNFELYQYDEDEIYYSYDHIFQIKNDKITKRILSKLTKKEQNCFDKLGNVLYDSLNQQDLIIGINTLPLDLFKKVGLGVIAIKYLGSGRVEIVSFGDIIAKVNYVLNNKKNNYQVNSTWNNGCISKVICFDKSPQMNVSIQKRRIEIDFTGLIE